MIRYFFSGFTGARLGGRGSRLAQKAWHGHLDPGSGTFVMPDLRTPETDIRQTQLPMAMNEKPLGKTKINIQISRGGVRLVVTNRTFYPRKCSAFLSAELLDSQYSLAEK